MRLVVASKNPVKVGAVEGVIQDYPLLSGATVEGREVISGVSDQPLSLEETIRGAKSRANQVFSHGVSLSFGIESGIVFLPGFEGRFFELTVCVVFNGQFESVGLSCAFEVPQQVAHLILNEGLNLGEAALKVGMTEKEQLGAQEGAIGVLTHGRMTRKDYTKQALISSLVCLENPKWYSPSQ